MSVRPLLFGLRSPGTPMLRRNMQYKRLFADEVIVTVAGTAMSITLGILTGSVWAIVLGMLFGDIIDLALSYILVPVQPRFEFSREAFEAIRGLGVQVFFNTLLMAVWLNLDRLIGLRFVDAALMGLYAIAWNLSSIVEALITRWTQVHFAMLSREEDLEERERWHELIYNRVARLLIPPVSLGIVGAPLVIQILYDPRYVGAGILLSILTARLMIRSLGQIQFQYLLVGARVKLATWSYLVAMVIQAAIFYPMVTYFGIIGLASCILISTTVLTIVQTAFIYRTNLHGYLPVAATLVWMAAGLACTQPFVQFVNRFITF